MLTNFFPPCLGIGSTPRAGRLFSAATKTINPDKGELLLGQEHRPRRPKCLRPFDPAMDGAGFVLQL
jgi:hypothetical protein